MTTDQSARCPWCHDLFIPEHSRLPVHFLDTDEDATSECPGSGYETGS